MSKKNPIILNFIIQKLKNKHTSLNKYTNWAKLINTAYTYKFQLKTTKVMLNWKAKKTNGLGLNLVLLKIF